MQTFINAAILGLALLSSASVTAGEVYQWKDAQGVTHYSESPPPNGAYQQRNISSGGEAQIAQEPTSEAAVPTETAQCTAARKNMEALQTKGTVQIDNDGDGKPDKTLTDADRANQLELAQATIKATCLDMATAAKS